MNERKVLSPGMMAFKYFLRSLLFGFWIAVLSMFILPFFEFNKYVFYAVVLVLLALMYYLPVSTLFKKATINKSNFKTFITYIVIIFIVEDILAYSYYEFNYIYEITITVIALLFTIYKSKKEIEK